METRFLGNTAVTTQAGQMGARRRAVTVSSSLGDVPLGSVSGSELKEQLLAGRKQGAQEEGDGDGGGSWVGDEERRKQLMMHRHGSRGRGKTVVEIRADLQEEAEQKKISLKLVYFYFLILGQSTSFAWFSISTAIPYFAAQYNSDSIYRVFLLVYNAPAIILLFLQTKYDDYYDRKFGSATAYAFRIVVATAVLCAILLGAPFLPVNLPLLCFLIAIVGIFDSVGYGAMSQMSGRFGGKTSTMLFVGQSITSFWLVMITAVLGFGEDSSQTTVIIYFYFSMGFTLLGGVSYFLVKGTEAGKFFLSERASTAEENAVAPPQASMWKAAAATWHLQVASAVLWFCIGSIQAFFGSVPSSKDGDSNKARQSLAQFSVYINLFGAFIGKVLAIFRGIRLLRTTKRVMIACLCLLPFSLFYALYITQVLGFLSDIFLLVFLTFHRIVTGYLSAIIYTMVDCDEDMKTQAVSFLNVTTFVGILSALSYAFALSAGANLA